MGKLTVLKSKAGALAVAVDTAWGDPKVTNLTAVLEPCSKAFADRSVAIWSVARSFVTKACTSLSLIERSLGSPENEAKLGTMGLKNLKLAKSAFELFWGPLTVLSCAEMRERMGYLKAAFLDDFTVRLIVPQPVGKTSKASVLVKHKASKAGADDYTHRIKFFELLVSSGKFDDSGINSMAGTLVHEMSHLVLATVDHVYGAKKSSELSDAEKLTNADNYKYYCELFQYRDLKIGFEALNKSSPDLAHEPPEGT
jgi:hypothetical protein